MEKKKTDNSLYRHWLAQVKMEEKEHKKFRERAKKAVDIYLAVAEDKHRKFNIFWSNVQTVHAAVFSNTPKPDVARRYLDNDPISRDAAEVLQRAINYSIDSYNFKEVVDNSVDDELTASLGQVRVRYEAVMEPVRKVIPLRSETHINDLGEPEDKYFDGENEVFDPSIDDQGPYLEEINEQKTFESVYCETIAWDQFRWQPARNWNMVDWAGFDHYLTRDELKDQFGEKARAIPLNYGPNEKRVKRDDEGSHALVHEIFDKKKRRILIFTEGMDDFIDIINEELDQDGNVIGLNLKDFYPFPEPLISTTSSGKYEPIPDYYFYQDLANELNVITRRINALTAQLKYRGIYDASFKDLGKINTLADGQHLPVEDFTERFEGKDLRSVIMNIPLEEIMKVIQELSQRREEVKNAIFELIGISDVIRGVSKASETLGAQEIKRQFAGLRISLRQDKVSRFVRDIFRIKAEIIGENFSPETLSLMTGKEVTPEVMEILRSDVLRQYKVDVESDSTVIQDAAEEQKRRTELLNGVATFVQALLPAVQIGLITPDIMREFVLFGVRGFKGGRQLEEIIESVGAQLPTGADPTTMGLPGAGEGVPQGHPDDFSLLQQQIGNVGAV